MWKKISSKVLLEHPRLTVVEDTVLLPNGTEVNYLLTPAMVVVLQSSLKEKVRYFSKKNTHTHRTK